MTSYNTLPPEVWIGIVNAAHLISPGGLFDPGSPIIQNLALTSTALYTFAQPYIYYCIKLQNLHPTGRQRSHELFDIMSEHPERRRWIKYLSVDDPTLTQIHADPLHNDYGQAIVRLRERFSIFFLRLEELRGLQMLNMTISAEYYSHILSLRHLRVFQVYKPKFADTSQIPADPESLPLTSLTLLGNWVGNRDHHVGAISRLILRSPQLKHMHHGPFFPVLESALFGHQQSPSFPSLLSLAALVPIGLQNQRHLARFLRACPNLLSLHLLPTGSAATTEAGAFVFPQSLVPKLRQYSGPLGLAGVVVRGRPISQIRIILGPQSEAVITRDSLYPLLTSSVPVTTLHLEVQWWDDGYLANIVDLFGNLEDLAIRYQEGDYRPWSKSTVADLRPFVHLKRLELGTVLPGGQGAQEIHRAFITGLGVVPEDTQRERLIKLAENKPSLKVVQLCHTAIWVRDGQEWKRSTAKECSRGEDPFGEVQE